MKKKADAKAPEPDMHPAPEPDEEDGHRGTPSLPPWEWDPYFGAPRTLSDEWSLGRSDD